MNCKPGDLAIVVSKSEYSGWIVEVLYSAPCASFNLPDGFRHEGLPSGYWVIKAAGAPFVAPTDRGSRRTHYAVAIDKALRPLRDNDGADETLTWKALPSPEVTV